MQGSTFISIVVFACGLAHGIRAEDLTMPASKPEVRRQVVSAIEAQLAAFRVGDVRTAYSYAAAALRAEKPFAQFVAIVKINYPEIWANRRAEFGIVRDNGDTATVLVHVFSAQGAASYDYTLVRENNAWRVHDILRHDPTMAPDNV